MVGILWPWGTDFGPAPTTRKPHPHSQFWFQKMTDDLSPPDWEHFFRLTKIARPPAPPPPRSDKYSAAGENCLPVPPKQKWDSILQHKHCKILGHICSFVKKSQCLSPKHWTEWLSRLIPIALVPFLSHFNSDTCFSTLLFDTHPFGNEKVSVHSQGPCCRVLVFLPNTNQMTPPQVRNFSQSGHKLFASPAESQMTPCPHLQPVWSLIQNLEKNILTIVKKGACPSLLGLLTK